MSNDNINKFMKDSSLHITNINQFLRNAKSEVLVDFIYSDISSITIVTDKIMVQSNLYIIENYIKKVKDCYNLKLELRLHLGKDLRKDKEIVELVKRKDTGVYLCYIYY